MKEQDTSKKQFETFLKDKQMQAEFDRRIAKALDTATMRWKKEQNQLVQDILSKQSMLLKKHQELVASTTRKACYQEMEMKQLELDIRITMAKHSVPSEAYVLVCENDLELATHKVLLLKKLLEKKLEE